MNSKIASIFQKILATEEALVPIFVTSDPLAQTIAAAVITTTTVFEQIFGGIAATPAPATPAPTAPVAPAAPAA